MPIVVLLMIAALLQACATSDLVDYTEGAKELKPPAGDRAQVVFYRPSSFGGMVSAAVYEDPVDRHGGHPPGASHDARHPSLRGRQ